MLTESTNLKYFTFLYQRDVPKAMVVAVLFVVAVRFPDYLVLLGKVVSVFADLFAAA